MRMSWYETYGKPINSNAVLEINFNYKPGQHHNHGQYDDLSTNFTQYLSAWNDENLDGVSSVVSIHNYVISKNNVFEAAIPLSELGNPTYFNSTFVNIWDYNFQLGDQGCDPSDVDAAE